MNYELLSRLAMQDSERLKSENLVLIKKNVILEQEVKNLKEFNEIIEKENKLFKERFGQLKNENSGLVIEKNLLLDEIEKLEKEIEKLTNKILLEQERKKVIDEQITKTSLDKKQRELKEQDETPVRNRATSVEFYS
ncbi:hypothetical protein [Aliarcobacter vitoriensis]|uniref:Uncharacterized protein n=1 Tax=Aliarcobacter vitoriensis TaxID=2011099 RepID=A0A366MQC3_9BACT|nr:hypothetical protein [Aliarcobacter vitoriensis]RBQ28227.1 hypothetical protein CRU91_10440 [Aliarcobacter vitoriensis]